jgi:hypothetical protein
MSDASTNGPVEARVQHMHEQIEALDAELAEARKTAEQVPHHHDEHTFAEAGSDDPDETDTPIAPPG